MGTAKLADQVFLPGVTYNRNELIQFSLATLQIFVMTYYLGNLRRKDKSIRSLCLPCFHHFPAGHAKPGGVDLYGWKLACINPDHISRSSALSRIRPVLLG
jgi:hypothetical protein